MREIAALLTTLPAALAAVSGAVRRAAAAGACSPCRRRLRVVIYRRLMLRIAERLARAWRAQALVTGDVVGQVASQTLENLTTIGGVDDAADLPAADRHGQGRDHRRGAAARHVSDLDHSRSGLLHAVHAAPSGDARRLARHRGGGAGAADRRHGRAARSTRRVVEDFRFPVLESITESLSEGDRRKSRQR